MDCLSASRNLHWQKYVAWGRGVTIILASKEKEYVSNVVFTIQKHPSKVDPHIKGLGVC